MSGFSDELSNFVNKYGRRLESNNNYCKYYFMNRGKSSCQIATNHKVLVAKVRPSVRNVPATGAILSPAL